MIMWVMSDRAHPAQLPDDGGLRRPHLPLRQRRRAASRFVKFHWKPLLGVHSLVWDEAQKIAGQGPRLPPPRPVGGDRGGRLPGVGARRPDRRGGGRARRSTSTCSTPTKLIPEELVPVRRVGKLTLNRNPDNFFAETEQVAFHLGNVVPGIDFTNDPLLQGRLFSYLDTQLTRLGGPELPRDPDQPPGRAGAQQPARRLHAARRSTTGQANYQPNSLGGGCPFQRRRDARRLRRTTRSAIDGAQDPRAQRELLATTSARRRCSGTASPTRSRSTSSRPSASSSARSSAVSVRERMVEQLNARRSRPGARGRRGHRRHRPAGGAQRVRTNTCLPRAQPGEPRGNGSVRTRQVAVLVTDGVDSGQVDTVRRRATTRGRDRRGHRPARRQGDRRRRAALRGGPRTPDRRLGPVRRGTAARRPGQRPGTGRRRRGAPLRTGRLPARQADRRAGLRGALVASLEPDGVRIAGDADGTVADRRRGDRHSDRRGERGVYPRLHRCDRGPPPLGPAPGTPLNPADVAGRLSRPTERARQEAGRRGSPATCTMARTPTGFGLRAQTLVGARARSPKHTHSSHSVRPVGRTSERVARPPGGQTAPDVAARSCGRSISVRTESDVFRPPTAGLDDRYHRSTMEAPMNLGFLVLVLRPSRPSGCGSTWMSRTPPRTPSASANWEPRWARDGLRVQGADDATCAAVYDALTALAAGNTARRACRLRHARRGRPGPADQHAPCRADPLGGPAPAGAAARHRRAGTGLPGRVHRPYRRPLRTARRPRPTGQGPGVGRGRPSTKPAATTGRSATTN